MTVDEADQNRLKKLVFDFCLALNEWENLYYILVRVRDGHHISDKNKNLVAGLTEDAHLKTHAALFEKFITPRDRKYGSNPGKPTSWSKEGSFFDISIDNILSVEAHKIDRVEVGTPWGFRQSLS